MLIRSIKHKGLKRFVENNDARGIRPDMIERARNILAVLISAENMEGVKGPPSWRIHQLSGDWRGTWSISVTRNWRITFEAENNEIVHLDLEDYH